MPHNQQRATLNTGVKICTMQNFAIQPKRKTNQEVLKFKLLT